MDEKLEEAKRKTARPVTPLVSYALAAEASLSAVALVAALAEAGDYGPWYVWSNADGIRPFELTDSGLAPTCSLFTGGVGAGGALGDLVEVDLLGWVVFALVFYVFDLVTSAKEALDVRRAPEEYRVVLFGLAIEPVAESEAAIVPAAAEGQADHADQESGAPAAARVSCSYLWFSMSAAARPDRRPGQYRAVFVLLFQRMNKLRPLTRWMLLSGTSYVFEAADTPGCIGARYTYASAPVLPTLGVFLAVAYFGVFVAGSELYLCHRQRRQLRLNAGNGDDAAEPWTSTAENQAKAAAWLTWASVAYTAVIFVVLLVILSGDGNSSASFNIPSLQIPRVDLLRAMTLCAAVLRLAGLCAAYCGASGTPQKGSGRPPAVVPPLEAGEAPSAGVVMEF